MNTRAEMARMIIDLLRTYEEERYAETDGSERVFQTLKLGDTRKNVIVIKTALGVEFQVTVE